MIPKCNGCEKTTPFFGEVYGRMSKQAHGSYEFDMCHEKDINGIKSYENFNSFKNRSLIPFYSTILAIKVIYSIAKNDMALWIDLGLELGIGGYFRTNPTGQKLFAIRIFFALIPFVGTIINGALDLIAQVGLIFKMLGNISMQSHQDIKQIDV